MAQFMNDVNKKSVLKHKLHIENIHLSKRKSEISNQHWLSPSLTPTSTTNEPCVLSIFFRTESSDNLIQSAPHEEETSKRNTAMEWRISNGRGHKKRWNEKKVNKLSAWIILKNG